MNIIRHLIYLKIQEIKSKESKKKSFQKIKNNKNKAKTLLNKRK